ncbi:hypothetical protein BC941DRAFT_469623 [Chlamydoabsidia padenii]|nr:hypothetical protein BC941DRAFT_469623 [Chlamydoabsidia padenii]
MSIHQHHHHPILPSQSTGTADNNNQYWRGLIWKNLGGRNNAGQHNRVSLINIMNKKMPSTTCILLIYNNSGNKPEGYGGDIHLTYSD